MEVFPSNISLEQMEEIKTSPFQTPADDPDQQEATLSDELQREYQGSAEDYRGMQKSWAQFALAEQWDPDVADQLKDRGHAPIEFNYVTAGVEQAVAHLTASSPGFTATGRDDSDTKKARMVANYLAYLWYISDGNLELKQVIYDYFVKGMGYIYIFSDPNADWGRGELMFRYVDTWQVVTSASSKHRLQDDAHHQIMTQIISGDEFKDSMPGFEWALEKAQPHTGSMTPVSSYESSTTQSKIFFPDEILDGETNRYKLITRLTKIREKMYRVYDVANQAETIMTEAEFMEAQQDPEFAELLRVQALKIANFYHPRIKQVVSLGNVFLYKRVLPVSKSTLIPFPNKHTGSPYPLSDVALTIVVQEFLNKLLSLFVAYTQTLVSMKLLVPSGSIIGKTLDEVGDEWKRPDAVIEYDPSVGIPIVPPMSPMGPEIVQLIMMAKHMIEYQFGIFESSMGGGGQVETFRGTMAIDEFGQRRMKSKLRDIEMSLTRVGQVLMEWSQSYYTIEKFYSILLPTGDTVSETINKKELDRATNSVRTINDITTGRYDVIIVSGSTLPSNRWAEWEVYKEAYTLKLIDREEALKKSEIFDTEAVLERTGEIQQLSGRLQQALDEIKELEGDLQTSDREGVHAKKQVEVEKFKTKLNNILSDIEVKDSKERSAFMVKVEGILNEFQNQVNAQIQDAPDVRSSENGERK
ncbi:MAG: hypothetical protein H8D23_22015 [Candidatus Brocadiales bacterium]|nr:hypothetical protein [Candidatus Brocadiales bacterium]